MKKTNFVIFLLPFMMAGCGGNKMTVCESEGFITVDLTKTYPKKELILHDFMDVEYVALETNDDFLCQGIVLAVGREIVIVKNQINDGDLFVFDRNGKALQKFNRKGQGGEEYTGISGITLDEDYGEMYVNTYNKILVYDFFGNFKRSFPHPDGVRYGNLCNFDGEYLICHDSNFDQKGATDKSPFVIISKQDGSVKKEISMACQEKDTAVIKINHNGFIMIGYNTNFSPIPVISYQNSWIITSYLSDTVFQYFPDQSMIPFIVRTPPVNSKNADSYFTPVLLSERYYFLQTQKKEPEVRGTNPNDATLFYRITDLVYDRQEKAIYESTVFNDDYSNKITVDMLQKKGQDEIAFWEKIEAYQLVEALERGELKNDKLKEIAARLDLEDNPVIMLVKHKR